MLTRSSIDWQRGKKINFHFAIPNPVCQWGGGGGGGGGVLVSLKYRYTLIYMSVMYVQYHNLVEYLHDVQADKPWCNWMMRRNDERCSFGRSDRL